MPLINIPSLSFSKLSNFLIVSPSNNQLIYYNNSAGVWENTLINSSFLSDFNIISPIANQILQYISGKWVNSSLTFTSTLSRDTDVSLSSLINNQLLQYNSSSSKWINFTPTYISNCSMGNSTDVTLSSLANNNLLMYNGSKWINITMS